MLRNASKIETHCLLNWDPFVLASSFTFSTNLLKWFGPRTKSISTWFRLNEIAKVRTRWASIFHSLLIGEISLHSFLYWRSPFLNCSVTWKGLPLLDCTEKHLIMKLQNGKFIIVIILTLHFACYFLFVRHHTLSVAVSSVCKTCVWSLSKWTRV